MVIWMKCVSNKRSPPPCLPPPSLSLALLFLLLLVFIKLLLRFHMGEPQEVQLRIIADEAKEPNSLDDNSLSSNVNQSINRKKPHYRWIRIAIYITLVLVGQSVAILLGRLYYEKGGKSKWLETFAQLAGFPILLPYYFMKNFTTNITNDHSNDQPSASILALAAVYLTTGLLIALDSYIFSIGLNYLPVSTFSLITSSQLAFNAFFSYFLNSLKFTPYIINSLFLLTISSVLLVFEPDDSSSGSTLHVSKKKYVVGFICTIAGAIGSGLALSLTQFAFEKVIKKTNFRVVMDMTLFQSLVATLATMVGLFGSGDWNGLNKEMEEYEMGKVSYVLNLTFTAIIWQLSTIGAMGLIFEVSSLFSNAISVLCVPIVPVLAVIFFHEKMHGIKAISLVLAVWGFIAFAYQHYLDDRISDTKSVNTALVPNASSPSQEDQRSIN